MNIETKLAINKFVVDEDNPHIDINDAHYSLKDKMILVNACPAGLYKLNEDETLAFDYAGCLECGTCRVLSLGKIIKKWEYPSSSMGIEFRYG